MKYRDAGNKALQMADKFPVIVVTGPRQSGKTTLCKKLFTGYRYVSLENPDILRFAETDPRGFLTVHRERVILDEAQRCPVLFSYMQQIVDESGINGQYIITGSQNFLLLESITQSLAGRVFIMELLPFSQTEQPAGDWCEAVIKGGYPRIYDKNIDPGDFFPGYIKTYIERDVRTISNVHDLSLFRKFIDMLAHNIGQLLNFSHLSKDLGVDVKTLQRWFSILETSYIVFALKPWHRNFAKRLVKMPKVYFYDSGIPAYLLGIENRDDLILSPFKGGLFENFAITECMKAQKNKGKSPSFFFWRDSNGNEIDLVIAHGNKVKLVEIKASETVKPEYLKSLHYLDNLQSEIKFSHILFNTMNETQRRSNEMILSWKDAELTV
jgi:predicted AAA+ superfamily ATPase